MKDFEIDMEKKVPMRTWDGRHIMISLKDLPEYAKKSREEKIAAGVWKGDK